MRYQLVLQWSGSATADYDAMVELEELLDAELAGDSELDGHDVGANEVNIFIHTDNPKKTFATLQPILAVQGRLNDARVAFRQLSGSEYTILWPHSLTRFKIS